MQTTRLTDRAVSVRREDRTDLEAVRRVHTQAFGRLAEANLVDVLRRHWQVMISLVAEAHSEVVGHALLTQVMLMPTVPGLRMLALGPIGVLPEVQGQGIGSKLIQEAIAQAKAEGWQALVALGRPEFYARFGFVPARQAGLETELRVPSNSFLILELQPGIVHDLHGVVRYQPEFSGF